MKHWGWIFLIALAATFSGMIGTTVLIGQAAPQQQQDKDPLPWAYGGKFAGNPPRNPNAPPPDTTTVLQVPGSTQEFTRAQLFNLYGPADWHPEDYQGKAVPEIVAHGKKPDVWACADCHLPNGKGRPENAAISGLPVEYFIQQMNDFKNGLRHSAEPRKDNVDLMIGFAQHMNDSETQAAAEFFGSIAWTPWIRVVESSRAPKTQIEGGLYLKLEGNQTEPLGERIIEVPEDTEQAQFYHNDHSGFVAYVPMGSIRKGETLVKTGGGGKTIACTICHGAALTGIGPVPPLAGRSPSYIARQIYDMQHSARYGPWSALMTNAVAHLTNDDIVNICAYIASRPVGAAEAAATKVEAGTSH